MTRQPLGRGLNAILGEPVVEALVQEAPGGPQTRVSSLDSAAQRGDSGTGQALLVPIERIVAGRGQPRRHFDEAQLEELAESIRSQGVIQPLVVTRRPGGFELIAGERRLRAAARAGLEKVPVVVRETSGEGELLELALVENLQREDLGALERARAYDRLMESFGLTQEEVARRVGKSRTAVANTVRLLALPQPVQDGLERGLLTEGHARALLGLAQAARQIEAMQLIARKALSVRDTEELVREWASSGGAATASSARRQERPSTQLEQRLARSLGTKVRIRGSEEKGRIEIQFYSGEELDRLLQKLGG